jgi:hypothetical protein
MVVIVPVAHPLVVLTVSHVLPLFQPEVKRTKMKLSLGTSGRRLSHTDVDADHAVTDVVDRRAQQKRVPHPPA